MSVPTIARLKRLPEKKFFHCLKLDQEPDLGFVGAITKVDTAPIKKALEDGLMPIISSTASDENGQCYNVNADTVAAEVAISLGARRLVYLSDVPGLLQNPEDSNSLALQSARRSGRFSQKRRHHRQRNAAQSKQCRGCPQTQASTGYTSSMADFPTVFFSKFLPMKVSVRRLFTHPDLQWSLLNIANIWSPIMRHLPLRWFVEKGPRYGTRMARNIWISPPVLQ